ENIRIVEIGKGDIVNMDENTRRQLRDDLQINALRIRAGLDRVTGVHKQQIPRCQLPEHAHRHGLTEFAEVGDAFQMSERLRGIWLDANQPRSPLPLLLVQSNGVEHTGRRYAAPDLDHRGGAHGAHKTMQHLRFNRPVAGAHTAGGQLPVDVQPANLVIVGRAQVADPAQLLVQVPVHPGHRRPAGPPGPVLSEPAVVLNRRVVVFGEGMFYNLVHHHEYTDANIVTTTYIVI